MNDCDHLKGRMKEICTGAAGLSFRATNRYRESWGLPKLTIEQWGEVLKKRPPRIDPYQRDQRKRKQRVAVLEAVGTAMREQIRNLINIKGGSSCGCDTLVEEMNRWGIDGCERRRKDIVDKIVANRPILFDAIRANESKTAWQRLALFANAAMPDALVAAAARIHVNRMLDAAIAMVRSQKAERLKKAVHTPRTKRRPYTGWRSEAQGPHFYRGPFETTTRCLTYHVWPTRRSDCWQWNLDELGKRIGLFNGPKAIGIATDEETATPDEVLEYASNRGIHFDHVITVRNNRRLREVATFLPMLHAIGMPVTDPGVVVFSGHAKGTQYNHGTHTAEWTKVMYASCLDYWPLVEQHLRHAIMTGSFRQYGLLGKWHDWAYSGTFFWWRAAEIAKRVGWNQVDQWFAGTESWPGKMCDPRETRALFMNDSTDLYVRDYWEKVLRPEWARWQQKMRMQSNAQRGFRICGELRKQRFDGRD